MRRAAPWQLTLALVPAAALTAAVAGSAVARPVAGGPISIRESGCGTPPADLAAGRVAFPVTDETDIFARVYLVDDADRVYAEIPWLTPGRTLPLATTLAAGHYAIRCVLTDGRVHTTSPIDVTGSTKDAAAGYKPLLDTDMHAPVAAYTAWIHDRLPELLTVVQTLDADVARGDLAAAEADWLTAHLGYERLGAAYGSFGDFDGAIDGTSDGLPDGTADKDWAGLHAIEYGLWHGATAEKIRPLTQALVQSVQTLITDFPSEEVDPEDLALRAHEILENTLEFQITGASDAGSGTSLATAYANTQGTQEVLSTLMPLLDADDPGLRPRLEKGLAVVQQDLLAECDAAGTWTAATALSASRRERIDADLSALLEDLATIPNLLAARTNA
jgi:iron uptake system EfeUOB component EfeO/EfeM